MSKKLCFTSNKDEYTEQLLSSTRRNEMEENSFAPYICIAMETIDENTDQDGYRNTLNNNQEKNSDLSSDAKSDIHMEDFFLRRHNENNYFDDPNKLRPKSLNEIKTERETPQPVTNLRRTLSKLCEHDVFDRRHHDNWSAVDHRIGRLNTTLLDAIELHNIVQVERMLNAGANPNATCRAGHISACHAAAYVNSDALHLLLNRGADRNRKDKFGRTPLHLAAWAGKNWSIAMLLNFPVDLQYQVVLRVTPEAEEQIKRWMARDDRGWSGSAIDVPCELPIISVLPQSWKDSIEHKCRRYMTSLAKFFSGWTPLHTASCAAHHDAVKLLLAAGANPNSKDAMGLTPLDIAGSACYRDSCKVDVEKYVKTVEVLVLYGGKPNTAESTPSNSALHTAVELNSVEAIHTLLAAGASVTHRNTKGNTPLHECVEKFYKEPLEVLAKHCRPGQKYRTIDVSNSSGYTVLHMAILASWIPGVCVALDAGADVYLEDSDGHTAIQMAARKGNLDILNEILRNAEQYEDYDVNYNNGNTEPPVFCAIRSGCLDCVQAFLDAGASLKLTFYVEPKLGETTMEAFLLTKSKEELSDFNMILHATAEVGSVDMLELLLDYDKNLENLLEYRCPYLMNMTPVEFAAFHNKLHTFKFLLQKTVERAQVKQRFFDSSMLLEMIASCDYVDLFDELIALIPDAVRSATENGHYPLHDAVKNGNRHLIRRLIHYGADLSQTNDIGVTAISLVIDYISKPTEFFACIFDDYIQTNLIKIYDSGCEITVDYRVLMPTSDLLKDEGQMRVLIALLKTKNRKNQRKLLAHPLVESFLYLKWQTLSPYFYVMIFLYGLFVMSVSVYIVSVFFYKDTKNFSYYWSPYVWQYIIYFTLGIIFIQELSCTNLAIKTWAFKVFSIEHLVKCGAYTFALLSPQIITIESEDKEWRRHLASLTLVLAWLNIMMLLSKTPISGFYIQMFWKVSKKIIKILLTFLFLILMFSFCFMVEFQSLEPFEDPWAAIVKTLVMMTSEFDYSNTFTKENAKCLSASLEMLRIVFVIFLIFAAVVLMNLMIGVAVHDVQHLVLDGTLRRLDQQVEFLNRLEISRGKRSFFYILGLYRWFNRNEVPQIVKFKPVNDSECCFKGLIKEAILCNAEELSHIRDEEEKTDRIESKLDNIIHVVKENEQNILSEIYELQSAVTQIRKSINHNSAT